MNVIPITRPRLRHRQDSFADYAAIKAVNWSTLREMASSPLHYQHRLTTPREDTARMAFGRAVHCAVLEPDRFALDFVVYEGARRAGGEWQEFAAVHAHQTILKADEYEAALDVRDAVRAHPAARRILRYGKPEVTLQWVDEETHVRCKARLDWLTPVAFMDLKTTKDVEARTFGRLATNMDYPGQMAFYRRGLEALGRKDMDAYIVAVEADPPFDVAVYQLDEDVMYAADEKVGELLARLKECRRKRRWPGRSDAVQQLDVPPWYFSAVDDQIHIIESSAPGR